MSRLSRYTHILINTENARYALIILCIKPVNIK